ncbi:head completion/stabilization protein [Alteraurantiacibacter buctensis]|uniref:Head completion/stabilization protein n=1 Tax=Alteraurantiacibacter buctensis TaxID=1503981 RepID=A0A844Z2Z8_9SPHN|nr:head completion/stabilization protein [Alteraurantiacibacter buctensis]MXO73576.1 hypothetical protein [Alteraurantiacibacter buctensis]
MTGLVAPAPTADADAAAVVADGWFPPVPLASIRETLRLGEGAVTTARLVAATEGAMLTCLRLLSDWRSAHAGNGVASLAAVTDQQVNQVNMADLLWLRAVRYFAAAELMDGHRDLAATQEGSDRSEAKDQTADHYRRIANHAVADLLSIGAEERAPRNRVSLV